MTTKTNIELWKYIAALLLFTLLSFYATAQENYYWVGGEGNWSDFENHWATTSGGTEFHESAPSRSDYVFFDQNSFDAPGQRVTFDISGFQYVPGMNWTGADAPEFYRESTSPIIVSGSFILDPDMDFNVPTVWMRPLSGDAKELNTNGLSLENVDMTLQLLFGNINVIDTLSVKTLILQGNGASTDATLTTNGNGISAENFICQYLLNATYDFTGSTVYAKHVELSTTINSGQVISTGATLIINGEGGTTDIDKSTTLYPFFENYIVAAHHTIGTKNPIFENLEIRPGVELLIDDAIDGIEFESFVANGTPGSTISIKSDNSGTVATLTKNIGEVNLHQVTLQDIEATGGAVYNAFASVDNGNVSGFTFLKDDQEITFALENKDYEDINEVFDLDASSTSGLDITYTSSNTDVAVISGTNELLIIGMGTTQITASQAGDVLFNEADPVIRVLEVTKADQEITFDDILDTWIADEFTNLTATASSNLDVDFQVSGPAILNGNVLEFNGVGTVQVIAKQTGNDNYLAAQEITRTFEVFKQSQSIDFSTIEDTWIGDGFVNLNANATSELDLEFQVSGPASLNGQVLDLTGTGTVQIIAKQSGNDHYLEAENVVQAFDVFKRSQVITFPELIDTWIGEEIVNLSASSDSDLSVEYLVSGPASLDNNVLTLTGAGMVQVTATQPGDNNYLVAEEVIQTFEVFKREQAITFQELNDIWIGEEIVNLSAVSDSDLAVEYQVSGPASLSNNVLTLTGVGMVQVTATQPGDDNYLAAGDVIQTFEVFKRAQVITFPELNDIWVGEEIVNLSAVSDSDLAVEYQVSGPATLTNNVLTLTGAGTVLVTAIQTGDNNYLAAEEVVRTFEAFKRAQEIVFDPIEDMNLDEGSITLNATSNVGLPIAYEVTGPVQLDGNQLQFTGVGEVQITAIQQGDDYYMAATSVTQSFEIFKILGVDQGITVEVYPNPVMDKLNVKSNGQVDIFLYNSYGQEIFRGNENTQVINTSDLAPGRYYLKSVSKNGTQTHKLIKG